MPDDAAISLFMYRLEKAGATEDAVDRAVLARFGLRRVSTTSDIVATTATTQNDITLIQPKIYYDQRYDQWVALSRWQWNHNCFNGSVPCFFKDCYSDDCGGPDGFGERFTHTVNNQYSHLYTYDEFGYQTSWSNPTTNNSAGTSFIAQDTLTQGLDHYNWDSGWLYYRFYIASCTKGTLFKLYSNMTHTWSTTSVTGFGISVTGFNISWDNGTGRWDATNGTPTQWYPCG